MKKYFVLTAIVCFVFATFGQVNVMTPELLWKLKRVGGVQVSPDGEKMFYSVSIYDVDDNSGRSHVKFIDVNTGQQSKLEGAYREVKPLSWVSNNEVLAQRGEALLIYNLDEKKGQYIIKEGLKDGSGFKLSPDRQTLLYIKDVKLDQTINEKYKDLPQANAMVYDDLMYRHWDSWHDYKYSHIFVIQADNGTFDARKAVDIMRGKKYDSPLNPFGGMEQITFSSDSKSVVYTCKNLVGKDYAQSTNSELYQYSIESRLTTKLPNTREGYDVQPIYGPKGGYAWLSMGKNGFESDKNDILYSNDSKSVVNLTKDIDLTVSDFVFGPKEEKIYFKSVIDATYQLFELNIKTKTYRQITEGQHNYTSIALAGKYLVGTRQDMNHPNEVYKVNIKSGEQVQLTNENKAIFDNLKLCKIEKRMIKTTDNKEMLTWVIYPPNFDPNKKYPTLLYCQGGPQSAVSQFYSFRWNFQLMASKGYIVVAPNRRGLPGFGQEWNDAISKDWGGQPMDDYLSAIDEVSKESYVDENKLGAVGASYGGYSVYYLAGIHNKRFKAFISHCGLFNLESWYGTTEELFFANWDIGGPYWKPENKELYLKNSPHKNVDKWDTPMLVIHGGKDYRVPLSEGMQAFQAAQLQGVPSKFLYFPEESHWVLSPQNGLVWHREFFSWLDNWLKK